MHRNLVPLALVMALVLPPAALADDTVHIKVNPASAIEIAMLTKAASGLKPVTIATTDPQGEATVFLNTFANVSKREKVQAYMRDCKDGKHTLILGELGATLKADENCKDKLIGVFQWRGGVTVTINTATGTLATLGGGGLSPWWVIVPSAAGGGTLLATQLGGGGGATTPSQSTTPASQTPSVTPQAFDYTVFGGTFTGTASKTQDSGCQFDDSFNASVVVSVNKDGSGFTVQMMERVTRSYSGTIQQNGAFTTSGNNSFGPFTTSGGIAGQIAGRNFAGDETINFNTVCPGKTVVYHLNLNK